MSTEYLKDSTELTKHVLDSLERTGLGLAISKNCTSSWRRHYSKSKLGKELKTY